MPTSLRKKEKISPSNLHSPSPSPSPSPPPSPSSSSKPPPSPPRSAFDILQALSAGGTERNPSPIKLHRHHQRPLWHPRPRHQNSYPPSLPSPLCQPMEVGDEFVDFKAFKAAMADWSINGAHKFTFRHQKSGKARSIVVCARAGCSECMQPWIRTARIFVFKLHSICFALTQTQLQAGFVELEEISPQEVNYLRNSGLELWATPRFPGKRYGHNMSNIVESLNNWILEARKLSIVDLLHSLWCKTMDLRFRHRQDG